MKTIEIAISGPICASIRPPGSKSITNRALICAALADGRTTLTGALDSEDTQVMLDALQTLGLDVAFDREHAVMTVKGCGGSFPVKNAEIYVGNSGTTARFLAAVLSVSAARNNDAVRYRIFGKSRMHERPVGDLIASLRQLGAEIRSESGNDCPPIIVTKGDHFGGTAEVPGVISSQFLSALLLASPVSCDEVILTVRGELVSKPYIDMTLAVMNAFGASVEVTSDRSRFMISKTSRYQTSGTMFQYDIEPDASAAGYFFAAAAVTGGTVTVEGLSQHSLQGDIGFCRCLEQMGCGLAFGKNSTTVTGRPLCGVTVDMNAISDTVMTLGVVALFAEGKTRITHVGHIRYKETDRLAALACELRKFGATVDEHDDGLEITPPRQIANVPGSQIEIDTYDDHRMAMSFAVAGLKIPGVVIRDPDCTAKTYPGFFGDLDKIRRPCNV
ncbi:MAG: 3-phosphoshikimate 1-carboxyvinyltransferase [Planctomycetaceae bacterium]|nr:3-phosphoshikimate 1-carboxyvinyltransferase [Planctomycetaceae bacterium]